MEKGAGLQLIVFSTCLSFLLFNVVGNGLLSTSVSSVQNRYHFKSVQIAFIAGSSDAGSFSMLLIITLLGNNVNKPRWLSAGTLLVAIGALVFACPHFFAPEYEFKSTFENYCGHVTEADCGDSKLREFRYVFMAAMFLIGAGVGEIFTHSVTYIDENSSTKQSSEYISLFYVMSAVGSVVGFLLGGAFSDVFVHPSKEVKVDSSNVFWVGAWWPGYLITGSLMILAAIPFHFLPQRIENQSKDRTSQGNPSTVEYGNIALRKLIEFKELFTNPIYLLCCLIVALNHAFTLGFNTFGVKYVEAQYDLDTFSASIAYGVTAVIAVSVGHGLSGFIMSKYQLKIEGLIKFCIINSFISVLFTTGFFFFCKSSKFAGATVPYADDSSKQIQSNCNRECACSLDWYSPVLGSDDVLYYSPCFAGCKTSDGNGTFSNCQCILDNNQPSTAVDFHIDGKFCMSIIGFGIVTGWSLLSLVLTISPTVQITLRRLEDKRRPSAIGLQELIGMLLGNIPGRVLAGKMLDLSCVAWGSNCGETVSCKVYDKWKMSLYSFLLLFGEAFLIFIVYVLIYFIFKRRHSNGNARHSHGRSFDQINN